jgi:hypothetical protein
LPWNGNCASRNGRANAKEVLVAKECPEIGTIKMGNNDGRVKQYPLSALA